MTSGRRVVVEAFGDTPLDGVERHLRVEPQERPEAGPGEVVVAVTRAAVGWVDLLMTSGQYQHMPKPPYVPGLEYAGVVAAVGEGVRDRRVGERVLSDGLLTGPRSLGSWQAWGGFASWAKAPEAALRPIPGGFSDDQACALLSSYETAVHCLVTRGRLREGETVLILGASGATGVAAVHTAKLLGATVIATGRSERKLAIVAEQGADHVIATPEGVAGLREAVKALTGGKGVDVVYDALGGEHSLEALRCVRFGARFLIVGWAATPFVAEGQGKRGAPNANVLPTNLIMMKGLDVLGCPAAISVAMDPRVRDERLALIDGWVAQGRLVPFVEASYAFDDVRDAMRAKWESRHVGAVVLRVTA